jgi:hypothetical protein
MRGIGHKLNKILVALPTGAMVLLFVVIVPLGRANPDATVFVDPKENSVEVGQTFAVNINIANVSGLLGFDLLLSYNATVLQLVSVQEGSFLKSVGPTFMINLTTDGGVWLAATLYAAQGQLKSANGTGVLATATFKAMAEGESLLDLYSKDPYKPDEIKLATDPPPNDVIPIPNVAIDGHVVVLPDPPSVPSDPPSDPPPDPPQTPLIGDINGDGRVDMKDIGYVSIRFGTGPSAPLWDVKADLNGDGKVNMKDIGTIAKNFGATAN